MLASNNKVVEISKMSSEKKGFLSSGAILNDKWLILDLIGKGAMGEVYRAHQLNLQRDVAVKIISEEWLQSGEEGILETKTITQWFHREFQAMAQVRHTNVLQIYDYGSCLILKDEKKAFVEYIVMEYIPGATLRFTMSNEGLEPDEILIRDWIKEYFIPVLDGVQALHNLGIIHRDLKPENILMDGSVPKITDFGLARSSRLTPLSQTGDAQGTLSYMSPEQFVDFKHVDQRGDIFSLGRILYEALTGKITRETIPFKMVKLSNSTTPFLQKLDRIIQFATAEDRERRLESVEMMRRMLVEAIEELDAGTNEPAISAPKSKWANPKWIWGGIALVLIAVMSMTFWHLLGNPWKTSETSNAGMRDGPSTVQSLFESPEVRNLPKIIMGEDGINMRLVPGGTFDMIPEKGRGSGEGIQVKSFYMDETRVTVHHFAEFLNEVKKNLKVENGMVKSRGQIWYLLGQGTAPYEYIFFEHGRFHLDPRHAADPVTRVTWQGAAAYARHFKKRLPTELEWRYAAFLNTPSLSPASPISTENRLTLKDMGGKIYEWAVRGERFQKTQKVLRPKKASAESIFLGNPDPPGRLKAFSSVPSEGFRDVGFRCVEDVQKNRPVHKRTFKKQKEHSIRLRLPWEHVHG